jgi:glutamate carboxypeptidase
MAEGRQPSVAEGASVSIRAAVALAALLAVVHLSADGLTPVEQKMVASIDRHKEAAIDLLARSVDIQSATENHEGVRLAGQVYAPELGPLGFETRWVEQDGVGRAGHFVAEHRGTKGTRILIIGHLDTVLQGEPFRRDGKLGYGSGSSDMKAGNAIAIEALRALHAAGQLDDRQVIVVFTGDEEDTGKPYEQSRAALIDAARRSDVALAFEGYEPGTAVVGRRGFSSWRLEVTGSQGHSSGIFGDERGSGAIFEAARILSAFHDQLREPYLTFNPSVMVGGTQVKYDPATFTGTASGKTNVVPRSVVVEGDMRFLSLDQLERARGRMRAVVAASLPRTSATITFADGMPAMTPTDGNRALLTTLDQVSRDLGTGPIVEQDPSKRGAGDISFVSGLVSGLDGLGGQGGQGHAPGEFTDLDEMLALTKRAALLMHRVLCADPPQK